MKIKPYVLMNPTEGDGGDAGSENSAAVETDGSDVYEGSSGEESEIPSTDMAETEHTEEKVTPAEVNEDEVEQHAEGVVEQKEKTPEELAAATLEAEESRIAKIAAAVVKQSAPQAPAIDQSKENQSQEPELSPEQVKQLLNPIEVTADSLRAFGIESATPEMVQGVQAIFQATVKNAVSVSNLLIEQKLRSTLAPYEPYVNFVQQQQAKQHIDSFYTKHGDLKKYEKFVQISAQQISPRQQDGSMKSADQVYDEVATNVRNMLKEAGVTIASPAAKPSAGVGGRAVPKMAGLATSGRSLGGQPSGERNNPDSEIY
jgi:hypothetical protein